MTIEQISIFIENRKNALAEFTNVLATHNINIRAMSLADTSDFGIARIIVDNVEQVMGALERSHYIVKVTPVIAIEIPDEAGGLDKLLDKFTDESVNIEYMYAFPGGKNTDRACMIFRVADTKAAEARLTGAGVKVLTQEEISNI